MDISKIFLNQYVHNNIVSTCNQCDKSLMREKYFYTVFDIYCVLYTAHLSFDQMHLKSSNVLDNPRFTVLLVRTSMDARE